MVAYTRHARRSLLPPALDDVARAKQSRAAIAGKCDPGFEAFFGYRRQHWNAGKDGFGELAAEACPVASAEQRL